MISKRYKTIFIHIEKTGGTSIEKRLGLFKELKRGVQDHSKVIYYEHLSNLSYDLNSLKFSFYHLKRYKLQKALFYLKNFFIPELTNKEYQDFYKFTIVRNTWSRLYSWYFNVMNDNVLREIYGVPVGCDFEHFINNYLDCYSFNQLSFIKDSRGDIPLDFIGRFENLDKDFKQICESIGLENSVLPKLLVTKNKKNYIDFYNESSRDLVYNVFKDEINYFNFEFGE